MARSGKKKSNILVWKTAFWALTLGIAASAAWCAMLLEEGVLLKTPRDVRIPARTSLHAASELLEKHGLTTSGSAVYWLGRMYSAASGKSVQAGYYRFSGYTSTWTLLHSLFTGKQSLTANVSFPEGLRLRQFASLAQRGAGVDSAEFVRLATSDSLARAWGADASTLEGYLAPDTYNFFWRTPAEEALRRLYSAHKERWEREFAASAKRLGISRREALTMASIVEAEAALPSERARIAGVYWNRLKKNMKLEADPTVQYAMGEKRRVLYSDLESSSPYNTYRHLGLPPGPIGAPSAGSIAAALSPEQHDYLYFVASSDGGGGHVFSKTGEEHIKAAALYRKSRR